MTLDQTEPYILERSRDRLYREAVLAFLGVGNNSGNSGLSPYPGAVPKLPGPPDLKTCAACRASGRDTDCGSCVAA